MIVVEVCKFFLEMVVKYECVVGKKFLFLKLVKFVSILLGLVDKLVDVVVMIYL